MTQDHCWVGDNDLYCAYHDELFEYENVGEVECPHCNKSMELVERVVVVDV